MPRCIVYIDGFNLFHGLKARGWRQFYWIDPYLLALALVGEDAELAEVKYFTARVLGPDDSRHRQGDYLDALRSVSKARIIEGRYRVKHRKCFACDHAWETYEEKMTDSSISSHIVADAFLDAFDEMIVVGGDTDVIPPLAMVATHFPRKRRMVWFPPKRRTQELEAFCDAVHSITGEHLKRALMPDVVRREDGREIHRPDRWSASTEGRPDEGSSSTPE